MSDAWTEYAARKSAAGAYDQFLEWADPPFTFRSGDPTDRYAIVMRTPCPGVGWILLRRQRDGSLTELWRSQGAFYNDAPDHPEGAIEWARQSTRADRTRYLAMLAEYGIDP